MRREFEKRLEALESKGKGWLRHASYVDYADLADYENDNVWTEIHHDQFFTAFRHAETGEVVAAYRDRRSDEEIVERGGDLEYA